ncbi:MAG: Fur family transcriptional regulator [Halofilum sp. (in: g-proteobacteria)]
MTSTHSESDRAGPDGALERAERLCRARGARLTPQRRRVYELLIGADGPLTAYELLRRLAGDGGNPAPPTVYRALEFLQAHGLVHRLASHNRYVACDHPGHGAHGGVFLVCERCGHALEWSDEDVARVLTHSARAAGFQVGEDVLPEVEGLCPGCVEEAGE